jgi:hypothetical protein
MSSKCYYEQLSWEKELHNINSLIARFENLCFLYSKYEIKLFSSIINY